MNSELSIALIGCVQALAVAVLAGLFARDSRKRKQNEVLASRNAVHMEELAAQRARESLLSIKLAHANTSLCIATAHAVQNGKCNGYMSCALQEAERAQAAYQDFIKELAVKHIA